MTPNPELVEFIKEARRRGFEDYQIKEPLLNHGWALKDVEEAFNSIKPNFASKNKVTLYLSDEIMKILEKRAKKNMLNISEQVEDVLRRSCVNSSKIKKQEEKLDDMFISLFSRRNTGRK